MQKIISILIIYNFKILSIIIYFHIFSCFSQFSQLTSFSHAHTSHKRINHYLNFCNAAAPVAPFLLPVRGLRCRILRCGLRNPYRNFWLPCRLEILQLKPFKIRTSRWYLPLVIFQNFRYNNIWWTRWGFVFHFIITCRVSISVIHRLPKPRRRVRLPYPAPYIPQSSDI